MAIPFEMTVEQEAGIHIVSVAGALDAATLDEFTNTMGPLINGPLPNVILYCKKLQYMNSRSIGQLSHYHRTAMVKGGKLVFWGLSTRLLRSFERLRLKDSLILCETKEDSLAHFAD